MNDLSNHRIKLTVSISPEANNGIRTMSTTTMVPMSRLVERAIVEYLSRHTQPRREED